MVVPFNDESLMGELSELLQRLYDEEHEPGAPIDYAWGKEIKSSRNVTSATQLAEDMGHRLAERLDEIAKAQYRYDIKR